MYGIKYDIITQNSFSKENPLSKSNVFTEQYGQDPLSDNAIRRWLQQFQETGNVLHRKGAGGPSTSQKDVDRFQGAWKSYIPSKARMLKLFSILHY
jgi:hypothetical protein